jgi:hypothetical protein
MGFVFVFSSLFVSYFYAEINVGNAERRNSRYPEYGTDVILG